MNTPPKSEKTMTVPVELKNSQLIQLLINHNKASVSLIKAISEIFNQPLNLPKNFTKLNFDLANWNIERNEIKSILHFMIWKIFGANPEMLNLLYKPFTDKKSDSFTRLSQAKYYLSRNEMFPAEDAKNIPVFNVDSNYGEIATDMYSALLSLRKTQNRKHDERIVTNRKRNFDEFNSTMEVIFLPFTICLCHC